MRTSLRKQRGLSFLSLVMILGLIGFFVLLILKIGPIYLNQSKVKNTLKAVKETPNLVGKTKTEISDMIAKSFNMNYVTNVPADAVTVVAQPGYVKVRIEYERVEKIAGNLNVLVQFDEGFEAGTR